MSLETPLLFKPVYKVVLWGGRRFERWRSDLPPGPVGESWDLADHDAGMSVVESGPLAGKSLRELTEQHGEALVGKGFQGGAFPILIKLIDATDQLSVQVHPDDAVARALGVGKNGKTECWLVLEDGGELYQGTRPGVDRSVFERALAEGRVAETLNRFLPRAGDFFFMKARTVHTLGAGCLVYELQQTLDVTFRVWDWGRVGPDGKPRPMHLQEALQTIDFAATGFGPQSAEWKETRSRTLVDGDYFELHEFDAPRGPVLFGDLGRCAAVTCLSGAGVLATRAGSVELAAGRTALVPAAAGSFTVDQVPEMHYLVARPKLA